jgi:glucuronide carrier protein
MITAAQIGSIFVAAPFVPKLAETYGKRCTYIIAGVVGTVVLEADTIEYGEWKTGVRTEGTVQPDSATPEPTA